MSLIGSLEDIKIADVLRLFSENRKTGLMTVSAPGGQALLRFQKGAIVHASAGRFAGDDAVIDLFGWKDGQLSFVPEDRSASAAANVSRPVTELIEEGLRVGLSRHRMHALIPSDRVVFQLAYGPVDENVQVTMGAREWRIIRLLDGVRDIKDIVAATKLAHADVVGILFALTEAGFLQRVEVQKVLRVQLLTGLWVKEAAELDERLREEWTRVARFDAGVTRVQVRTMGGKSAVVPATFRGGLGRDIHLPRTAIAELAVRDGEDVHVRPVP
jgi:hypothetical protein